MESRSLDELISEVQKDHLIESVSREGDTVTFSAGGEYFMLEDGEAVAFLESILQVARRFPSPGRS